MQPLTSKLVAGPKISTHSPVGPKKAVKQNSELPTGIPQSDQVRLGPSLPVEECEPLQNRSGSSPEREVASPAPAYSSAPLTMGLDAETQSAALLPGPTPMEQTLKEVARNVLVDGMRDRDRGSGQLGAFAL